ncbi:MAG: sulfurtransferase-like selenium metabolism protein YedF [Desulfotomaculaceae bacterium]|nr:sulfurtransferase-like selenium metabolism protein YedF [Desulfotomaculaceae bacterium]
MKTIDARGLACPEPVLLTKRSIDDGEKEFEVLVDSEIPKENIRKFCYSYNCDMEVSTTTGGWKLLIRKKDGCNSCDEPQAPKQALSSCTTFLITCNKIGTNDELGKILIEGFINTLPSATNKPSRIIFLNEGVFLTTENSPVLNSLKKLLEHGIEIKSCGTCLDFYQLKDKLQVGTTTNMYDTIEALTSGDVIIKI